MRTHRGRKLSDVCDVATKCNHLWSKMLRKLSAWNSLENVRRLFSPTPGHRQPLAASQSNGCKLIGL